MTTKTTTMTKSKSSDVDDLLDRACKRIAPTWPLDRFIAVNPFWERVDAPLPAVSAQLGALCGTRLVMPRAWFREQLRAGRLRAEHLELAIAETGAAITMGRLLALVERDEPLVAPRKRVMDVVDELRDLVRRAGLVPDAAALLRRPDKG